MRNKKELIAFLTIISAIALSVCSTFAMTVQSVERVEKPKSAVGSNQVKPAYLFSWTNRQLRTSQGAFFLSDGVEIVNKTGLDKNEISRQKNRRLFNLLKKLVRSLALLSFQILNKMGEGNRPETNAQISLNDLDSGVC